MKLISLTTFIVLNFILGQTGILNNKQNYISIAVVSKITQDTYNKSQLIGEWSFLCKDNDTKTKIENLTEGKILKIKKKYTYTSDVFGTNEKGQWSFNEKSKTLQLENSKNKTKWRLHRINEFGMVLIHLKTNEKWVFASS